MVAGDRPSSTKDAVQSMLNEQAGVSNSTATRNRNGAASTSLADVTITPASGAAPKPSTNGNGVANGNGSSTARSYDNDMDPCLSGQVEACAVTRLAEQERTGGPSTSEVCILHASALQDTRQSLQLQGNGQSLQLQPLPSPRAHSTRRASPWRRLLAVWRR